MGDPTCGNCAAVEDLLSGAQEQIRTLRHERDKAEAALAAKDAEIERLRAQIQKMHDNGLGESWVDRVEARIAEARRNALEEAANFVEEKHSGTEYGRRLAGEIRALAAKGEEVGRG